MNSSPASEIPTIRDVRWAAERLAGRAVVTPLLEDPLLNRRLGGRLLIKAECLQRTGSFKFRGACNRLSCLTAEERARGVVAFSSGNHAQGVAAAAAEFGVAATIVMPSDAPALKIANTRAWGAETVLYDRKTENREAIAQAIVAKTGAVLVPPFDDPQIIAGQGTAGLELAAQAHDMGAQLDAVLVPCSGGGLTAGVAIALSETAPTAAVHTVEPRGFDDTARSLAAGRPVTNAAEAQSICDALLLPHPGEMTFAINRCMVAGGLSVPDSATIEAMRQALLSFKLVLEPGGAVALAAALSGAAVVEGRTVAVIASGGNVDPGAYAGWLASTEDRQYKLL